MRNLLHRNVIVPFIILILTLGSVYHYQYNIVLELETRANKTLDDDSVQRVKMIQRGLDDRFVTLKGIGAYYVQVKGMDGSDDETLLILRSFLTAGDMYMAGIADRNGMALTTTGQEVYIGDRAYFQKNMQGEDAIQKVMGKQLQVERIILSVPLVEKGEIIGSLFGSYALDAFQQALVTPTYNGKTFAYICDKYGNFITRSEYEDFEQGTNNLLELYSKGQFFGKDNIQTMTEDLENGRADSLMIRFGATNRYVSYFPLGINDWYLFNVVSETTVAEAANFYRRNVIVLIVEIIITGLLLIMYILWNERKRLEQKELEQELLRESEERYRLVESLSDSVLFEGDFASNKFTYNDNFYKEFHRAPGVWQLTDHLAATSSVHPEDQDIFIKLGQEMNQGLPRSSAEYRIADDQDNYQWCRVEFLTLRKADGSPYKILGKITNINDEKFNLLQLKSRAERDSLTNLYNNNSFKEAINSYLTEKAPEGKHAFIIVDVDDFKQVNDTAGHQEGDRVLREVAKLMVQVFAKDCLVGRLGGDEFAVLAKNIASEAEVEEQVTTFLSRTKEIAVGTGVLELSCSIGIAFYKTGGSNFAELFKNADTALYKAKAQGKKRSVCFGEQINEG
ncbi:MAG: sensor domain-containing diguanylate cyclase [Acidaminococcaceae bacterium]